MTSEEELSHLVYHSVQTGALHIDDVTKILNKAKKNNRNSGITGFLIYDGKGFLQLLEGTETEITKTFNRITRDTRHTDIQVIFHEPADRRHCPSWLMAYQYIPHHPDTYGGTISKERAKAFAKILKDRDDPVAQVVGRFLEKILY